MIVIRLERTEVEALYVLAWDEYRKANAVERVFLEPLLSKLRGGRGGQCESAETPSETAQPCNRSETWIDAVDDPGGPEIKPEPIGIAEELSPAEPAVEIPAPNPGEPTGTARESLGLANGAAAKAEPAKPPPVSPGEENIARVEGKGWRAKYTPQDMVQVVRALAENPKMAQVQLAKNLNIPFVGLAQVFDLAERWADLIEELRKCPLERKNVLLAQLLRSSIARAKRVGAAKEED